MRLYLMQHGDAVTAEIDPDRPLSARGREDVERLAAFLKNAPFRPARVLHSGKTRARQTAEMIVAGACLGVAVEAATGLSPKDDIDTWVNQADTWAGDTLLVGHLPFMGRFASRLVSGDLDRDVVAYQPGSMVCFERVEPGRWRLAWMIRPELFANHG